MDYDLSRQGCMDVLKQKKASPSLVSIPVIVMARQFDQEKIIELAAYNVKKIFNKPVMMDVLLTAIMDLIKVFIEIDKSPGKIEVHVNDDIIFVEVTEGLNQDKLELLNFKIHELMDLYQIKEPKLIVMISGISLSSIDAPNIKKLFENVLISSMARYRNVRILTKEKYIDEFIRSSGEYHEIAAVDNLRDALDGLAYLGDMDEESHKAFVEEKILADKKVHDESMVLRFEDENKTGTDEIKESLKGLKIAVVDDEDVPRQLVKRTFSGFEINLKLYIDGAEFIQIMGKEKFDLIFLDILMPKVDGFAVLREMKEKKIDTPVIIFSSINERDTVIRAFQMGVKSYITKPIEPAGIFKKALEILRVKF